MKKKMCLTLFMVATMLATNLTITPQSIKPESVIHRAGAMAKDSKAKVRRMWFCLRHQNQCSKQEATEAKRWVAGASAAAIAAALITAGIIGVTLKSVFKTQDEVNLQDLEMPEDELLILKIQNMIDNLSPKTKDIPLECQAIDETTPDNLPIVWVSKHLDKKSLIKYQTYCTRGGKHAQHLDN